ncbi:MAG TPA: hypothetical protein VF167_04160 [Longimicrobiaceae bacterium]
MQRYTSEQRRRYADQLCAMIREWIGNEENHFEFSVQRGVEWRPEMGTGDRHPRPNPSLTFTLLINGGARDTAGEPIIPAPRVFGDNDVIN